MNQTSNPSYDAVEKAARELAELNRQIDAARATLIRLQPQVAKAKSRVDSSAVDRLVETNKMLVVRALRANADAETATRALHEVSRAAELDSLTKLPNRALLLDRFAHDIATAKRHGARLALLFLDLDGFKQINDTLGHAVGDEVLKWVAHCLTSSVREADTVSRHGGDEFLILLADVCLASDAALIANKVLSALRAPSRIGDQVFHLEASIGISFYPDDGKDAATIIDQADAAMYRAKRERLGSFVFHDNQAMSEGSVESKALESQQPKSDYAQALVENDRRYALLREANERLVMNAIKAQERLAAAVREQ